jgi:plastocyanin
MGLARPAVALAAAGLLALTGCGEKRATSTGGASSSSAPATAMTVSETEFKLSPGTLNVPKAGAVTIEVKNDGTTQHALVITGPSGQAKTSTIAPGKTATLNADLKAGTYQMYCPIDGHRAMGMKGEIKVAGGGSGGGSSGGGSSGGGGYSRGGSY